MRVLFSSDAGQFQLLFLLLPCAVSVPSPFPVPYPVPFALSRGPASKNVFLVSFLLRQKDKLFLEQKNESHGKITGRRTQTVKRHWKRH